MRFAGLLSLLLASSLACHGKTGGATATDRPRADRPAVHGMVLVGLKAIHLSHLPMFHAPHDYQALLTVRLAPATAAELAGARAAAKDTLLYTIAPAPFRLGDVAAGFRFSADLVRGHFERGGETVVSGAPFEIERVVHFRRLEPGAARPAVLEYILFGLPDEAFLVHRISAPPDFDQVLAVTAPADVSADALAHGVVVTFPDARPDEALLAQRTYRALVDGVAHELAVGAEIYLEHGELAR